MYVLAVLAAILVTSRRWEARGGNRLLVQEVALWGFPAGLIGGRLYFDITSSGDVPDHWWGPFAVWDGGMGLWGGIALGVIGGILVLRRRGIPVATFLDVAAPALLVAQAIGRVGNWFNQELFGKPTSLPWGLRIDPDQRPPGYEQFSTFQPTFLYESIWDVAAFFFVVWADRRFKLGHGRVMALYVMAYTLGRGWIETLRIDDVEYQHVLGLRLNVWTSIVLFVLAAIYFVVVGRRHPGREAEVYTERRLAADRAAAGDPETDDTSDRPTDRDADTSSTEDVTSDPDPPAEPEPEPSPSRDR
jgi:prolipoprotein diacylglyceryl transferase